MKVAYVYDEYPLEYAPYLNILLDNIRNIDLLKLDIYSFNPQDGLSNTLKSTRVDRIGSKFFKSDTPIQKVVNKGYDIIHIQLSYLYKKFLPFFRETQSSKYVITLRGGDTYIKPWVQSEWREFYASFGSSIYFVVVCHEQKKYLHTKWQVPLSNIYVVPTSHNNTNKTTDRKDTNADVIRIASAFRMTWEKNIQGNLLLVKKLVELGCKVQYDIFGDGNDLGEVYYLVDRLKLKGYVNIFGKVDPKQFLSMLPAYHFYLQLSISEGLSASIFEAQSFGVPAIISDSGGNPEAAAPGVSAICRPFWMIDELAAEVKNVWDDKVKYKDYVLNSIEHSKKFSVENEIAALLDAYNDILKS